MKNEGIHKIFNIFIITLFITISFSLKQKNESLLPDNDFELALKDTESFKKYLIKHSVSNIKTSIAKINPSKEKNVSY